MMYVDEPGGATMPKPELNGYNKLKDTKFITCRCLKGQNRFVFEVKNKLIWSVSISTSTDQAISEFWAKLGKGGSSTGKNKITKEIPLDGDKKAVHDAVHLHLGGEYIITGGDRHSHWGSSKNVGLTAKELLLLVAWNPKNLPGGIDHDDVDKLMELVQE
jgi:hypothetical protein